MPDCAEAKQSSESGYEQTTGMTEVVDTAMIESCLIGNKRMQSSRNV